MIKIIQIFLLVIGATYMVIGNYLALRSKSILNKIHYLSAADTIGGIFILVSILLSKEYFFKALIALIILLIGSPSITYFVANALSKRGKKIGGY
ncbi:MAG: monovalent cation/H(+) antiporter subunit G [Thermosipho sp. (in: Bacteria)]|nr:monovalent cation/H(+) antiporter subunit G [Thermosipho sp. (in: thermotogales)]